MLQGTFDEGDGVWSENSRVHFLVWPLFGSRFSTAVRPIERR